jgi:hypothetical protein
MLAPIRSGASLLNRAALPDDFRNIAAMTGAAPRTDNFNAAWSPQGYPWISPVFNHKPLYFEQPNLERYGQGSMALIQPILSAAHFFGSIPLVPYKSLTHHPRERVYTLGRGRPGNCVPVQRRVLLGESSLGEGFKFYEEGSGYY